MLALYSDTKEGFSKWGLHESGKRRLYQQIPGGPVHNHIVNKCPLTKKFEGGLQLHEAKDDAVK